MRINGKWLMCDDGVVRPMVRGEVFAGDGSWERVEFPIVIVDRPGDVVCMLGQRHRYSIEHD